MTPRTFTIALLGLVGCSGPVPSQPQSLNRALAEDLDCAAYHVEDGTEEGHSAHLGCTGLFANWSKGTLNEEVRAFTPGYQLWSDQAEKNRWIFIPPDTQIDTGGEGRAGMMDDWVFPVGTKVWKQFRFGPRIVETRLLWKRQEGWFLASYLWSEDQSSALEYTEDTGLLVEGADPDGPAYEVPPSTACAQCHDGGADTLLGFGAISLAAEDASGLTLDELVRLQLLTQNPDADYALPGDPDAAASLGWLHMNCGSSCHNARQQPAPSQLQMRLLVSELTAVEDTALWRTGVGRASFYRPSPVCGDIPWMRIMPGNPDCSTVPYRISVRDEYPSPYRNQMPPLLSHRVPFVELERLRRWIAALPP
jgi:hypothetical protein